jgi:hypothetical protein
MRPLILSGLLALTATATVAQSLPPTPRFEVVSVRMVPSSSGLPQGFAMNPRLGGGRLTWTTRLFALVRYAYDVPNWRITGIEPGSSSIGSKPRCEQRPARKRFG